MVRGGSIPQEIIDEVKARTSFVELASEVLSLRRSGRSHVGLCPFHSEKTPSFHVHDEEGYFHCFGCGRKGSLFQFVMETRGLSFPEAVRMLANRAGVTIPEERSQSDAERGAERERKLKLRLLRETADQVKAIYQLQLSRHKRARGYLEERGLTARAIESFELGYAPAGWEFIAGALERDAGSQSPAGGDALPDDEVGSRAEDGADNLSAASAQADSKADQSRRRSLLFELGLVKARRSTTSGIGPAVVGSGVGSGASPSYEESEHESGEEAPAGGYDLFRDRIIFPIVRSDGATIAFGGRLLASGTNAPKYINSPESALYSKRRTLYGVKQALPELRRSRHAILVEGYMDVIALHERGLSGAVACCGTALSEDHAQVLARLVDRVTVLFDGDAAGLKAAARAYEMFLNTRVDVSVVALPDGDDPDTFARAQPADTVRDTLERTAQPALRFYLEHELRGETDGGRETSPAHVGRVAERCAALIAQVQNPVEREFSLRQASSVLGVSFDALDRIVRDHSSRASRGTGAARGSGTAARESGRFAAESGQHGHQSAGPPPDAVRAPAPPDAMQTLSTSVHSRVGRLSATDRDEPPPVPYDPSSASEPAGVSWRQENVDRVARGLSASRISRRDPRRALYEQLAVAVLCEPSLARTILAIPSLVCDSAGDAGTAGECALPEALVRFVQRIEDEALPPIREIGTEQRDAKAEQVRARFEGLLVEAGFEPGRIFAEAHRQQAIGGSNPEGVVADLGRAAQTFDLKEKLEVLRKEETRVPDELEKARIVQEKLLQRRSLERIR